MIEVVYCYGEKQILVNEFGVCEEPACGGADNGCQYYRMAIRDAKTITAQFGTDGVWRFKTEIPHETFEIFEDGELFCVGIVFRLEDCK